MKQPAHVWFTNERGAHPGTCQTISKILVKHRVAIFVNGRFWHSYPRHSSIPRENHKWRIAKLARKVDRETDRSLTLQEWMVFRVWEHENVITLMNRADREFLRQPAIE